MTLMPQRTIKAKIFRFDPSVDKEHRYQTYDVPLNSLMSVLDVLDYIYDNLDSSLAYNSHAACHSSICGNCMVVVNGKASLACKTIVTEDITVEPAPKFTIVRDLVWEKGGE